MAGQQRDIIAGPGAWIGSEIQYDESWIYRLDATAVAEIDAALAQAKSVGASCLYHIIRRQIQAKATVLRSTVSRSILRYQRRLMQRTTLKGTEVF